MQHGPLRFASCLLRIPLTAFVQFFVSGKSGAHASISRMAQATFGHGVLSGRAGSVP
ncbi:hypothetical protein EMEDMD4_490133 [Sinorhizobium medicae]|uniref:Uncharacterized protein n=1 Tax=Sinorhizobium medicae TaxID=110321 RepID=A0A508X0Q9_9HYPH|nr:hypothetical protein EMEDMD4_490133 [Sinorhizobium medicae]